MLLWGAPTASALTLDELASQPPCAALDEASEQADSDIADRVAIARYSCRLPIDGLDRRSLASRVEDQSFTGFRDGSTLTVVARVTGSESLELSGSLRGRLDLVSPGIAAARFHLAHLDRAIITLRLQRQSWSWIGPDAPALPERRSDLSGLLIEETLYSDALGETRRINVYLPPGFSPSGAYDAVFMGDGQWVRAYARFVEPLVESGVLAPLVIVGAVSGQDGIVEDRTDLGDDIRGIDYLRDFRGNSERFSQHMRFFSEELVAYAVGNYGVTTDARRRVVSGHSNAASLAFWAAYLHPDVFGNAIVMSQAWRPVENIEQIPLRARYFMSAGLYEQPFLRTTRRTATALGSHGYDVVFDEVAGGHNDFQSVMFVDRIQRIFARAPAQTQ